MLISKGAGSPQFYFRIFCYFINFFHGHGCHVWWAVIQVFGQYLCKYLIFLGGLSLHLNHLIASRMGICYRQFGTLPIGIFLSNLDSRQLDTSLMTSYGHFWHMSTFGDSRAVWVLLPKYGALRKSKFSRWRSDWWSMRLGGFRWADNWATRWYHFFGGATHLRGTGGRHKKKAFFRTFATA